MCVPYSAVATPCCGPGTIWLRDNCSKIFLCETTVPPASIERYSAICAVTCVGLRLDHISVLRFRLCTQKAASPCEDAKARHRIVRCERAWPNSDATDIPQAIEQHSVCKGMQLQEASVHVFLAVLSCCNHIGECADSVQSKAQDAFQRKLVTRAGFRSAPDVCFLFVVGTRCASRRTAADDRADQGKLGCHPKCLPAASPLFTS